MSERTKNFPEFCFCFSHQYRALSLSLALALASFGLFLLSSLWPAIFANLSAFGYFDALLKVKRSEILFKFDAINEAGTANGGIDKIYISGILYLFVWR